MKVSEYKMLRLSVVVPGSGNINVSTENRSESILPRLSNDQQLDQNKMFKLVGYSPGMNFTGLSVDSF